MDGLILCTDLIGDWQDMPGNTEGKQGRSHTTVPTTYSETNLQTAFAANQRLVSGLNTLSSSRQDVVPDNRRSATEYREGPAGRR